MACDEPFLGDISISPYTYAPYQYAFCDGSLLSIMQNDALFSLIGTNFGGNGINIFQLPDLRGRVPLGTDNQTYLLGDQGGAASATPATLNAKKPDSGDTLIPVAGPGTIQTLPPFLAINYIIAMSGIFPSRW